MEIQWIQDAVLTICILCIPDSSKEPHCFPAYFLPPLWISPCVCVCIRPQSLWLWVHTLPLCIPTSLTQIHTHTPFLCQRSCCCHVLQAYFWVSSCRDSLTCSHWKNHKATIGKWATVISLLSLLLLGLVCSAFLIYIYFFYSSMFWKHLSV